MRRDAKLQAVERLPGALEVDALVLRSRRVLNREGRGDRIANANLQLLVLVLIQDEIRADTTIEEITFDAGLEAVDCGLVERQRIGLRPFFFDSAVRFGTVPGLEIPADWNPAL